MSIPAQKNGIHTVPVSLFEIHMNIERRNKPVSIAMIASMLSTYFSVTTGGEKPEEIISPGKSPSLLSIITLFFLLLSLEGTTLPSTETQKVGKVKYSRGTSRFVGSVIPLVLSFVGYNLCLRAARYLSSIRVGNVRSNSTCFIMTVKPIAKQTTQSFLQLRKSLSELPVEKPKQKPHHGVARRGFCQRPFHPIVPKFCYF